MKNGDKRDQDSPQSLHDPQDEIEMRKLSGQGNAEEGPVDEDVDGSRTALEKTGEDGEWHDPELRNYLKGGLVDGAEGDSAGQQSDADRVQIHNQGRAPESRGGPPGTGHNLE